jgi:hypothetical protein
VLTDLPLLGAKFHLADGSFPAASYAAALGPPLVAAMLAWSWWTLNRALGLRASLLPGLPAGSPERERLSEPLKGSEAMRRRSRGARWVAAAVLFGAGAVPLVCGGMLLWDYSHKYAFDPGGPLARFNGPFRLWLVPAGEDVVRPRWYDGVESAFHPAHLPLWQPWLYLAALAVTAALLGSAYRQLGAGAYFRAGWAAAVKSFPRWAGRRFAWLRRSGTAFNGRG